MLSSKNHPYTTTASLSPAQATDSASMNSSVDDEFDFRTHDISSSAQTSTVSPERMYSGRKEPKLSSFSFYSGPAIDARGTNSKNHASQFRKSLIISPSFNSVTSAKNGNGIGEEEEETTETFSEEEPTRNIGMVISPSIRALSDILTSKVNSNSASTLVVSNTGNGSHPTIEEEDEYEPDHEEEDEYEQATPKAATANGNVKGFRNGKLHSLIDDIYSPPTSKLSDTSSNTLKNKSISHVIQQDLIDLSSPVVETTRFTHSQSLNPSVSSSNRINYSDIYESYSPTKETTKTHNTILPEKQNEPVDNNETKRQSNRFSMMSDSFNFNFNANDFNSPALGYNEPTQCFNLVNPTISKSFSKLSVVSSVHAIGYDDDDDDDDDVSSHSSGDSEDHVNSQENEYSEDGAFSFLPSRAGTLTANTNEKPTDSAFVQRHQQRDSIRIVKEADDKSPFLNDYLNKRMAEHADEKITPKLASVPNLQYDNNTTPIVNNVSPTHSFSKSLDSPALLNGSPIRNTSPTFENYKNSPAQPVKKTFINLSPQQKDKATTAQKPTTTSKSPKLIPKNTFNNSSQFQSHPQSQQPQPQSQPSKSKLTFKSLFSKNNNTNNNNNIIAAHTATDKKKSPVMPPTEKFSSRPKSFSFNNLSGNHNNSPQHNGIPKEEKKEKTRSLLSGWKRKSLGFTSSNKKAEKEKEKEKDSATSKHQKRSSVSSLPLLKTPKQEQDTFAKSPVVPSPTHKHSRSSPGMFSKQLPNLPPPQVNENRKSLLSTYGFDQTTPIMNSTPVLEASPELKPAARILQPVQHSSPTFNENPTVQRSVSEQTIQTSEPPTNLIEPQQAKIVETTPVILDSATLGDATPTVNHSVLANGSDLGVVDTSSVYDTTGNDDKETTKDQGQYEYQQPHALGIQSSSFTRPPSITGSTVRYSTGSKRSSYGDDFEHYMLKTPPSRTSPAFSVVASFTASPNKYHIGDDMFPKKFSIDEIESIVSLERSRSMKSIKSSTMSERHQRLNNKSSILRMVQDQDENFSEMVLPDGMIVVKSPVSDQVSLLSSHHSVKPTFGNGSGAGEPQRRTSILKNSVRNSFSSGRSTQRSTQTAILPTPLANIDSRIRSSMRFEQNDTNASPSPIRNIQPSLESPTLSNRFGNAGYMANRASIQDGDFDEFLDLINFDDDDNFSDLTSNFKVDTAVHVQMSPLHTLQRDSSVPDLLGVQTSFGSMKFDDSNGAFDDVNEGLKLEESPVFGEVQHDEARRYTGSNPVESIEEIIKKEESLQRDFNYSTQSLPVITHSHSPERAGSQTFKALDGPSFNAALKPETKNAIMGSLAKQQSVNAIIPSDSENSLSYIAHSNYVNNAMNTINKADSMDNFNEYAAYYDDQSMNLGSPSSPARDRVEDFGNSSASTAGRFSMSNPFTDYTQSYDDGMQPSSKAEQYGQFDYSTQKPSTLQNDDDQYGNFASFTEEEKYSKMDDQVNKRKSLGFVNKLNTNNFGHFSTSSLLVQTTTFKDEEKPKRLTKKKNRTSVSFGSMFESLITATHPEKPSVKFSSRILLYDTYGEDEYDRKPDSATCNSLTPQIAMEIKNELNELKAEMPVHEESRCYTHFF